MNRLLDSLRQVPVLAGLGAFLLFAVGIPQTIYVGDSGELVTAAWTLGIPHPPGYPLYVLLGYVWSHLVPLGSVAWRMGLFSAVCGAAAVALLARLVWRVGGSRIAAAMAAGLLAVAPSFWSQANVPRVYTLGVLMLLVVLTVLDRWYETRDDRSLIAAAFLLGLGAANHTVMIPIGLALGCVVLLQEPGLWRRVRTLAAALGAALAGLLPYLYLPLRSRQDPTLDWGDPETPERFWAVLTRSGYWDRRFVESWSDLPVVIVDWAQSLGAELGGIGLLLVPLGWIGYRRRWPVGFLAAVVLANVAVVASHGSRQDLFIWHRYYLPAYAALILLAGLGAAWLRPRLGRFALGLLLLPLGLVFLRFGDFDRSRFQIADDFSRTLLESLPPNSYLAAQDDSILFVLLYLTEVEHLRPDVDLLQLGIDDALPELRFDPVETPLFFTHDPNWGPEAPLRALPVGLAFQALPADVPPPDVDLPETLAGEEDPRVPRDYLTDSLIGHFHMMRARNLARDDRSRALAILDRASEVAADNAVHLYNAALLYQRWGRLDRAREAMALAAALEPRQLPGPAGIRPSELLIELERAAAAPPPPADEGASIWLDRAEAAARAGDLEKAGTFLDRAEALDPRNVLVYQYRANIAALSGDREAAIAALRQGLALEPDHPILRRNLEALTRASDSGEQ